MHFTTLTTLLSAAATASAAALSVRDGTPIGLTPHEQYASSIGVLGCKIDVNRVAYWPGWPDCNRLCVRVTEPVSGRSVSLLRIDSSAGAYDISYDAWNYLATGQGAATHPTMGGPLAAVWEDAPMSECAGVLAKAGGRLPFSAANSMNTIAGCPAGSWIGRNHALFNILDPQACKWGYDEECHLDIAVGTNQPTCPHQLGVPAPLTTCPVYNLQYGTGQPILAA